MNGTTYSHPADDRADLFLRETLHRCSNDLQLVVGLLSQCSRRTTSDEAREILEDVTSRVTVLAGARVELNRERQPGLQAALRQVCEALASQVEPSVLISMQADREVQGLTSHQVATLALAVNELVTNAVKHAFKKGRTGCVSIALRGNGVQAIITVDDDGLPFSEPASGGKGGLGLGLVKRLVASMDGMLISPISGSKCFEIRVPVELA